MPTTASPCVPRRVKMRIQAIAVWAFLSVPSIFVTILLFVWTVDNEKVSFFLSLDEWDESGTTLDLDGAAFEIFWKI